MEAVRAELAAYLRQQSELGLPGLIFSQGFLASLRDRRRQQPLGRTVPAAGASPSSPVFTAPSPVFQAPAKVASEPSAVPHLARVMHDPDSDATPAHKAKREALTSLYKEAQSCCKCSLAKTRTKVVFGAGNIDAPLMVIGEAPGADEDAQGLPFVGRAGRLLTDMLAAIKLDRKKHVFITNILKCRPPENRDPESTESTKCLPLLQRQVEIIAPKIILLLGRIAAHVLLENTESLAKLRGRQYSYNGIPVVVTYHPAALLRSAEYKKPAWEDLKKLQSTLTEMGVYNE